MTTNSTEPIRQLLDLMTTINQASTAAIHILQVLVGEQITALEDIQLQDFIEDRHEPA
jgi:hypothetical protein